MKKQIIIFTRFSKKDGMGHFIRSKRLHDILKKKYICKLYTNKNDSFIIKTIKKQKKKTIIILDFKKYEKKIIVNKKSIFYVLFDQNKIKAKNLISINPLSIKNNNKLDGSKWFIFPKNFSKKKKIKKFKEKLNIFICQGGTDANNNLKKIVTKLNIKNKKIKKIFVKVPKMNYINFSHQKIIYLKKMDNLFNILNQIDVAISGCGNFSYEINYFKIPTIYISSEKSEIIRGKNYQNIGLGKFFKINQVNKAIKELNVLMNDKNYYNKMIAKRLKLFENDNSKRIYELITKIFYKNVV